MKRVHSLVLCAFLWVESGPILERIGRRRCSLERMGFLPSGTLSVEFMLFAEYCQLVLAIVEVVVTKARETKEKHVFELARSVGASPSELTKLRRKCAMVRLEMCKFVSDLGKAFYDCELRFAHEGVFIGCAPSRAEHASNAGGRADRNVTKRRCGGIYSNHEASTTSSCARRSAAASGLWMGR